MGLEYTHVRKEEQMRKGTRVGKKKKKKKVNKCNVKDRSVAVARGEASEHSGR